MKAFEQYLAEAQKEYSFRLRCACDLTEEHMDKIENRLKKYEAFSVSAPKKTMFQASPPGFSHLSGGEIHMVDFKTRQPVAPHVLQQEIVECCEISESLVRVKNAGELDLEETPEASDNTTDSSEAILEQPYEEVNNEHMYGPKLIGNLLGELGKVARKNEFAGSVPAAKGVETVDDSAKSPIGS